MERKITNLKDSGILLQMSWFPSSMAADILQSFQCVGSGILEKERWEMYDTLQCGSFKCRSIISHDQFCKSPQDLGSNRGLV